ncbi:tetratricopeptide repeat protein [Psychrosphaera aestuarii]|uniref:tetratricopeptide repeat protein n=1 Tax=Psychrosphaera aestuarii TaxID=1266052 RepID=UPI001B3268D6|nr:tetratricopeptide repeat protein [Psychrosphaera aestuarii]
MDVVKACIGLGIGILLSGCAATYESAEKSYQKGEINEARKDWESLAKEGDVRSMYRLYTSARRTSGSDIEWLQKAADSNLAEAQYDYGMWLHGKEKYQASKDYLEKASENSSQKAKSFLSNNEKTFPLWLKVEKGDENAPAKLGQYYWEKKEYLSAVKWYERCTEVDIYCSFNLGLAHANGYGVTQDYKKAIEWYLLSSEKGNLDSARNLAWLYEDGKGTEVNKSEAFKWMKIAAKKGWKYASISLGRFYLYGIGTESDTDKAIALLNPYSGKDLSATYHLGRMYYLGLGVEKDYKKSYQLFSSKVLAEHAASIYYLAEHHYRGYGLEKELSKAFELYTKAAEKGDASATFRLGWMYANGEGVQKNDRKAFYWYTQASEKGSAPAQNNLAVMYDSGTATEKNKYTAFKWFKKSAEQGSATAQHNLAGMYEDGSGTRKDFQKAVYWYAKAAQQNHQGAQSGLNNILYRVTKKYINVSESSLYAKQDFDSQVIKRVGRGDTVYIISNSRGWSQVYFPENNSLGYVHNSHLR